MVHLYVKRNTLSDKIVIIDYKMGNLRSVQKAFEKVGVDAIITNKHQDIKEATKIVLPGVGAFKDAMSNLEQLDLISLLNDEVIQKKKKFLGICLGMQLLATKSYEFCETKGLGWLDAEIIKFDFSHQANQLKIPHVGWNNISYENSSEIFKDIPENSDFYFVHSYYFNTDKDYATSICSYGSDFISSVQKDNIYATQFHPEKSQTHGLSIIKNFIDLKSDI